MDKIKSKKKKVIVAMSGGVDSSVAAALLKKAGFEILGVFMKFWSPMSGSSQIYPVRNKTSNGVYTDKNTDLRRYENRCCSSEAEKRARKVARILEIPFYVLNFEKEFKKRIVNRFLKEYQAGKTPNPCVVCNKEIKFGLLLEKALDFKADFVATGHYARLRREFSIFNFQFSKYKLLKAKDKEKDQSYFLWQLNQKQLEHILFPVGDYTKSEVRKLAKKFKLPVLGIPESQEICFIPETVNDFLKKYLKSEPGKIINTKGGVIGGHQGLWFYTIGQRRGLGITGGPAFAKASAGKPYYVLHKDQKRNLLIVTKNEKDLYQKELVAKNVNWTSGKLPELPLRVKAKIRYRHNPALATITKNKTYYFLKFEKPQRAITPGQSVVFYRDKELLGGGEIK